MNKAELLEAIRREHERLAGLVKVMGEGELAAAGVVGDWSVKDILAHITAWDNLMRGWLEAARIGAQPKMPSEGYTWADMDKLNQSIYEQHKDEPLEKVLADFRASYETMLREIEGFSDEQLTDAQHYAWMNGKPLIEVVAAEYKHYAEFADHIEEWTETQGGS